MKNARGVLVGGARVPTVRDRVVPTLKGHCAAVAERGACCVLLCVACEWCVIENIMGPRRFLSANHNIQVWASGLCV